ncbi:hypothetical protein J1P26_22790 [Neobacillus sp. MM2021_6]|uniref:hypothetical protein n=1 Tax=Bacillaceae TaxID=186817 RepID=UPI00140DC439|nr:MULTISPECIES: hypothetical protein [Bacillaceae]MBO0962526.1 hypothetical protein [Neobacillus sp. MM2021_6]NHC20996.1 hypothetical protein [Bacillus sp. MM2020_4]
MSKHEDFKQFITDLNEKNISFYKEGAPFFIGSMGAIIQREEDNGNSNIKIDDVIKAMREAYLFSLGIY